jgi:hypothetical protein
MEAGRMFSPLFNLKLMVQDIEFTATAQRPALMSKRDLSDAMLSNISC